MTVPVRPQTALQSAMVAGVPIAVSDPERAVDWLLSEIDERSAVSVRFVNAFSVVAAHQDPHYLSVVRRAGVSFPDGTPVAWALRTLGRRGTARRVRGPSFFVDALRRSTSADVHHFFLGTTDATLDRLTARLQASMPRLQVAGTYAPPFAAVDEAFVDQCAQRVLTSDATCVWIALGTPKQDLLAHRLAERVGMPCVAIGAAFDFAAGTKREAPAWMQALGIEWVHRLLSEPGRLWRRYLIGNLAFLALVARHPRA